MITSEEFVLELDNADDKKNFKLGEVVELFENKTAKIKFDGEETTSEKQYAYLSSYVPNIDDRVLLAVTGGTYIILGKVNFNVSPDIDIEVDRYVFDLRTVSIMKGLEVSGVANFSGAVTLDNGLTIVGNVGVDGNITSTGLSSTGAVSGASLSTPGPLNAGETNLQTLTVGGDINATNTNATSKTKAPNIEATSTLRHSGSYLAFFGKSSSSSKVSVSKMQTYYDTDVNELRNKLNSLIGALQSYGLV